MKRTGLANRWRKGATIFAAVLLLLALCGCAKTEVPEPAPTTVTDSTDTVTEDTVFPESGETTESQVELPSEQDSQQSPTVEDTQVKTDLILKIDGQEVSVAWEDNESVTALMELAEKKPLTIQMSMYGGFEQVGPIGTSLPRNDVQTTTEAGDIVLYSGNQIVVFYGSNSWVYTRLGKITDKTAAEMKELLGNKDITLTLYTEYSIQTIK